MHNERGAFEDGSVQALQMHRPAWIEAFGASVIAAVLAVVTISGLVNRPVHSYSWREADLASIARNFDREGMNPLYPRVDWRGTGPGYAEMEFPFLSWSMAVVERSFGMGVPGGRFLNLVVTLVGLFVFFRLATDLLSPVGASSATLLFALHPLVFSLSTSLQPEPMMLLGYLAGVWWFRRWLKSDSTCDLALAMASVSLSVLAKATAAHILLLFALLTVHTHGLKKLLDRRFLLFGVVALLPPVAWYTHAYRLWLAYGNSLGVSNEAHALSLELLLHPSFLLGIPWLEARYVWMPLGSLLLIAGLSILRPLRSAHTELLWFLAIGAYYLAAAKSTAHQPLYYYHVVAVPPACLLIGRFVGTAVTAVVKNGFPFRSATVAGVLGTVALAALFELETYEVLAASLFGGVVIVIFLVLTSRGVSLQETPTWTVQLVASGIGTGAVIVLYIGTLVAAIRYDKFMIQGARRPSPLYLCAQEFAPQIQEDALILASGGVCRHPAGGPAAHNASYMFYWLDRKGFNICSENQSLQAVGEFIGQGVDYFVGEHGVMEKTPGFKDEVESQFEVAAECEDATLYRLRRAWLPDP